MLRTQERLVDIETRIAEIQRRIEEQVTIIEELTQYDRPTQNADRLLAVYLDILGTLTMSRERLESGVRRE